MKTIKVLLEYVGCWSAKDVHQYRIVQIVGAPTVSIKRINNALMEESKPARIGDLIDEKQADDLAERVTITTVGAKA